MPAGNLLEPLWGRLYIVLRISMHQWSDRLSIHDFLPKSGPDLWNFPEHKITPLDRKLVCHESLWRWERLLYSVFPNNKGRLSYLSANDSRGQGYENGSMYYAFASQNVKTLVSMEETAIPADPAIDLSRGNSLYGASETMQPAGLYGLCLIRAY